jgi:hypothetical protein
VGYGALAPHYEFWTTETGIKRAVEGAFDGGAILGERTVDAFRIAEGIPAYGMDMMERDLPQETSQMRALTSARAVIWARRLWSGFARGGACTGTCAAGTGLGRCRRPGRGTDNGWRIAAGQITSAAELKLASGQPRFCAGDDARGSRVDAISH